MTANESIGGLPNSWCSLGFEDTFEVIPDEGKRIAQSDYVSVGSLPVIDQGELFIGGYTNSTDAEYTGPLPLVIFGDHTRRVKYVEQRFAVGAQGVKLLLPTACFTARYLAYLIPMLPLPDRGYSRHFQFLRQQQFPMPPRPEQQRIVAEIEKQFTRLDAAVAALKRVQANMKRYRAAVLKAACEGRLVPTEAELARKESRTYETCEQLLARARGLAGTNNKRRAGRLWGAGVVPELTEQEQNLLPLGWTWAKVRDLGPEPDEVVQVGPMSMRSQDFAADGTPVLNVGCVQWGYFEETKLNHLPPLKARQFERYRVLPGDVMFTRSGTVGRCAVARSHQAGWLMTFHLLRARPHPDVCLPEYLRIVFEGASHIQRQAREASIGTTRAGFNTTLLAKLDIPLPPLAEQRRIVAVAEGQITNVSKAEAETRRMLLRADRLRQSILKRAFEGKLVPQDPNDEPASVLLERIRAERAINAVSSSNGSRRRSRKASSGPYAKGTAVC